MANLSSCCSLLVLVITIVTMKSRCCCKTQNSELQGMREKIRLENERLLKAASKKTSAEKQRVEDSTAYDNYEDAITRETKEEERLKKDKFQADILLLMRENNNLVASLVSETIQSRKEMNFKMDQLVQSTKLVVDVYNKSLGYDSVQHLFSVSASIKFLQKEIERVSWDRESKAEKKVDQFYAVMEEEIGSLDDRLSKLEIEDDTATALTQATTNQSDVASSAQIGIPKKITMSIAVLVFSFKH